MKLYLYLILAGVFTLTGSAVYAEMLMEGSATDNAYYTSNNQFFKQDKGFMQINYDARAVQVSDNASSPFHNASWQCVGSVKYISGKSKEFNLCTYTRPDGDQIYISNEGKSSDRPRVAVGEFQILGGTGKCKGISGVGKYTRTSLKGPLSGVGAGIVNMSYNWKIPEQK